MDTINQRRVLLMEEVNQLTDFERKLITIIQHNTRKGHKPSIKELELRSGRVLADVKMKLEQ
ncbi:hypothetical protein [Gracilibacillus thailandensis]|uniref:Uncharacterized protein n=1 Tax=Gracilibacillus thailandensis TaxID=563735 RepID=A0A6N7R317_9BACI|nr:hypothetical protein [Gracilibacillus thailandensis]MRI66216.1 hypothetical protein [Gracilibacillus thailandensis]